MDNPKSAPSSSRTMTNAPPRAADLGGPFFPRSLVPRPLVAEYSSSRSAQCPINGVINDWLRYFYDRWWDFQKLRILSFHNTKGDKVNNLTNATNPSILLPVVDGAINACRKNFKFVRVQLSVNFVNLVTVDNPGPTTLRIEYFIELPQTTPQMTNGAVNAYNLTTFHGNTDLYTLTSQDIQAEILDYTL